MNQGLDVQRWHSLVRQHAGAYPAVGSRLLSVAGPLPLVGIVVDFDSSRLALKSIRVRHPRSKSVGMQGRLGRELQGGTEGITTVGAEEPPSS